MTDALDTGDIVLHRPTRERLVVACRHDDRLHPAGYPPDRIVYAHDCELVDRATPQQRLSLLKQMAEVTTGGHRPQCARKRLREMEG